MSFEESIEELSAIIPFAVQQDFLEEIVLNSGAIVFLGAKEVLFRSGDPALGFYWLLKGRVILRAADGRILCEYPEGSMVGLDNFLNKEMHAFDVITIDAETRTLFVDAKCYKHIVKNKHFRSLLNKQLLWQLKSLKSAI